MNEVLGRLERRLERERRARAEAEALAEQGLRELYQRQREVQLLKDVAFAANNAATVMEALQTTLARFCEYTGWPVGHVYMQHPGNESEFMPAGVWRLPDSVNRVDYRALIDVTSKTTVRLGEGLPGSAAAAREPVWIEDIDRSDNFPRARWRADLGVRSGFAFPIVQGDTVHAVCEFFTPDVSPPDSALLELTGHIAGLLGQAMERERAAERIHRLAFHDPLTGLPNRRLFQDRLDVALAQATAHGRSVAVLFLDLDRFKVVNDTMGHEMGDLLLTTVADRLASCVCGADTLARTGGDEFVILIPEAPDAEMVDGLAARILDLMREPVRLGAKRVYVTCSIGAAVYPEGGADASDLLRNADTALYSAKQAGRERFAVYSPEMTMRVEETLRMETSLRDAIASQQFVVHYQPQVDIASGRIIGMEALVRWEHPELGVISPVKFIPLAEETGMILPLGEWVLRTACRDAAQWNRESPEPLRVSVNLSLRQLEQSDLVDRVRRALEDFGLPPELLDLEITESVASRDIASTRTLMLELRDLGVHLSLDDFGTGYSSLSHLSSLPMNTVKIDRSFVRTLLEAPKNAAIARSIIHMAHSLDLRVVAEGVEEAEQLEFLESNRCDLVQGYLYSPPVPASAFGALLKQQNENAETDRRAA